MPVLLALPNRAHGSVRLGQPLAAASILNRLQSRAAVPLLVTGDLRPAPASARGRHRLPAIDGGRRGGRRVVVEAARITAEESRDRRAPGLLPVADVNDNPRNPVINTRSFGESPRTSGGSLRPTCAACTLAGCSPRSSTFRGTATPTWTRTRLARHHRAARPARLIELALFRAGIASAPTR
ncbi:MAG: hypothetical protein R2752_02970 [Vicinamibacterales bacterium]